MKKYRYLLILVLSLILVSCFNLNPGPGDDSDPDSHLCSCNIDGSDLQIAAGAEWDDTYLYDAVFTGDGTKLTDGKEFVSFDGTSSFSLFPADRSIRDFCFNSDGSEYFCLSYSSDGYPSGLVKYDVIEDNLETLIDTINVYQINISKDDKLLAVTNSNTVYIIDISTKTILTQLNHLTYGNIVLSNNNQELYYKYSANINDPIRAINLATSERRIVAPHGDISSYNHDRTRFVYVYYSVCELLEIEGTSYHYTTLSSAKTYTYPVSINRQGTRVVYHTSDGIIINYLDDFGDDLLRDSGYDAVISPTGDRYLFYKDIKALDTINKIPE